MCSFGDLLGNGAAAACGRRGRERKRMDPCFAFDGFVPGDDEVHASTCDYLVSA